MSKGDKPKLPPEATSSQFPDKQDSVAEETRATAAGLVSAKPQTTCETTELSHATDEEFLSYIGMEGAEPITQTRIDQLTTHFCNCPECFQLLAEAERLKKAVIETVEEMRDGFEPTEKEKRIAADVKQRFMAYLEVHPQKAKKNN